LGKVRAFGKMWHSWKNTTYFKKCGILGKNAARLEKCGGLEKCGTLQKMRWF